MTQILTVTTGTLVECTKVCSKAIMSDKKIAMTIGSITLTITLGYILVANVKMPNGKTIFENHHAKKLNEAFEKRLNDNEKYSDLYFHADQETKSEMRKLFNENLIAEFKKEMLRKNAEIFL